MKKMLSIMFIGLLSACTSTETIPDDTINPVEEPIEVIEEVEEDLPTEVCYGKGFEYSDTLEYELLWSDEFNVDGALNSDLWKFDIGGQGWGNEEIQYYTNENAWIENGNLIIEARAEEYLFRDHTSSRIVSQEEGSFLYGVIEVRAKLPEGVGTWPAIWMLPTSSTYGTWPRSGEIDIMEHVGYDMNRVHGTIHTWSFNHTKGSQKGNSIMVDDVANTFHVYKVEWLPDKINFFVDDEKYFVFENVFRDCPTSAEWPFNIPFHIVMNIAIGGNWGGAEGVNESIFPQRMEVDYIRVYQANEINELVKEHE